MRCAAVIAAAGLSSRMRDFKPMLCLGNMTMIESVIESMRRAGVAEILVVTGYKSQVLRRHLDALGVRSVENLRFAQTEMYDSLCLGLEALESDYDAVFLTPGDVPLVQPETIRLMQTAEADMVRPTYNAEAGHPVLIRRSLVPALLAYHGKGGLRQAMETLPHPILDLEVDGVGITLDADTPEDFKTLKRRWMETQSNGRLWPDIRIHIAKCDTILSPENAQFIEMIGQTGSIQNACACTHMSYTKGWKLLGRMEQELGYPLVERFPGGTSGGGSTLTPRGKQLLDAYHAYREAVEEAAQSLFQKLFPEELHN